MAEVPEFIEHPSKIPLNLRWIVDGFTLAPQALRAQHGEITMRAYVVGVAALLMTTHSSAASLYRCEAVGVADPLSTCSLSQPGPASKTLFDAGFGLTFDAVSGLLRTGVRQRQQNEPSKFSVISPGNNQNDLVALYQSACIASCPLAFLKIRVWQPSMPFLYVDVMGSVWIGNYSRG